MILCHSNTERGFKKYISEGFANNQKIIKWFSVMLAKVCSLKIFVYPWQKIQLNHHSEELREN